MTEKHDDRSNEEEGNGQYDEIAESLAREYGVSPAAILKDAAFAQAVDTICSNCGEEVKWPILSGDITLAVEDIEYIARLKPDEQRQIIAEVQRTGKRPKLPPAAEA